MPYRQASKEDLIYMHCKRKKWISQGLHDNSVSRNKCSLKFIEKNPMRREIKNKSIKQRKNGKTASAFNISKNCLRFPSI